MSPVPGERSQAQDVPKLTLDHLNDTVSKQIALPVEDEAPLQRRDSQVLLQSSCAKYLVATAWALLLLIALFVVHPVGGAWTEVPILASLLLLLIFLLYQVIILSPWKQKFSSRHLDALAALWIWLLCFMLSFFSSPGRREVLAGEDAWRMREDPGNSTAAMWIICVLFSAAFSVDLPFREFVVIGQIVAFQHLLISAILPAVSSSEAPSFGGVFLGLPPWLVPSLQLHGIALALGIVRLWQEEDKQVRTAVMEYLEGKEVPVGLAPGSAGPVKTRIELITEFLDSEIDFLHELLRKVENLSSSNRAHLDWMRSVDFLLDLLTSSADVLKQTQITEVVVEERDLQDQLSEWIGAGTRQHTMTVQSPREKDHATANLELPGQIMGPESPQGSFHSGHALNSSLAPPGDSALVSSQAQESMSETLEMSLGKELGATSVRTIHGVGDWNFDALNVAAQHQSVLKMVGMEFLNDRPMIHKEHIAAFLETLESRYEAKNPYHSNVHAADMTNAVYFMFENCGLQERTQVSETSVTSMYIAALGHDVGHPGFNNNYLVNSRHDIAITYSDRSVLEYFHAAELTRLLSGQVKGVNFLGSLPEQQQKQERFWMTSLILNTDMSKLMQDLSSLRMKISSGTFNIDDAADQQYVMSWLFRSADIGHSAKPWRIHEAWSMRVVQEFHAQGDNELRLNLPISPLCDRTDFRLGKSQAGFLQFVCLPTFAEIKNLEEMLCEDDGAPGLRKMQSQGSGIGVTNTSTLSPPVGKTRTERPSQLGGGHGRRRSIAQLASSKSRLEMCASPQATPQATPQGTSRTPTPSAPSPLPNPQTPESTPRNPLSGRRRPSQPPADGKVAPEPSEKRRGSLGSSTSGQPSNLKITKHSTSSSLGSKRLARVIKTRVYLQCKENMEIWQKMAQEEEGTLAVASPSKGSSGHHVPSSSSEGDR